MIVNTASKCGLTPQYKDLEAVYKEYKDKGLVIVGFPANNFASQEPGTNEEIATFCQLNYGVTFPMMDKVSVKGDDMAAIYQFWRPLWLRLMGVFRPRDPNRRGFGGWLWRKLTRPFRDEVLPRRMPEIEMQEIAQVHENLDHRQRRDDDECRRR